MNQRAIINVTVVGLALIMAVFLGQWVVTAPKEVGIGFAGVIAIITFFVLKRDIWMLIPAMSILSISFPWIPGNFSPGELACLYVIAGTCVLIVGRMITFRIEFTALEWVGLLVILTIAQAFVRNPTGLRMLQSDYVGGRAYFVLVISVAAGLILSVVRTEPKQIKKLFKWCLLAYLGSFVVQAAAQISVKIASYTLPIFGTGGAVHRVDSSLAGRNMAARTLALMSSQTLASRYSPLKALLHPFWFFVLALALGGAAMSGFRNVIAATVLTLAFGVYYWGRGKAVIAAAFIAITLYAGINVVNLVTPLPQVAQRAFSFLPGTWNESVLVDAQGSTDWRIEMWKEVLTSDRYIQNKIIGDGLGIHKANMEYIMEMSHTGGYVTDEMSRERAMLAGDYHSGPVTSIGVVGYVGLLVFLVALVVLAIRAHKLIIRSRGESYFCEVLFFCLPMVWQPLFYVFIMGNYKLAAPLFFLQVGLLRLLERNLRGVEIENGNKQMHVSGRVES